jgi:serine/threonine protein phosphatase PrpC
MTAVAATEESRIALDSWFVTDVGVVRDHNEDSAFMDAASGFFIVADGMGGHAAGEVASAMAVETVKTTLQGSSGEIDAFKKAPTEGGRRAIVGLLQNAVLQAHQAVYQRGQNEQDKAGMGTTLDVVLIAGPEAFVAHVGDSRTYLVRDGKSSQITTDHTVAEVLVIEGKLTLEEAAVSPLRTILVNAIGVSADVGVEMAHVTLKRGDRMLLCSDGLHDYFPMEEEIAQRLSAEAPGKALEEMVELAKTRGGHDNITGIAVLVTDVLENVPGHLGEERTQPVGAEPGNPFTEEPTQIKNYSGHAIGTPPPLTTPSTSAKTQPMRAMGPSDLETATTIPPTLASQIEHKSAEAKAAKDKEAAEAKVKADGEAKTAGSEAKPAANEVKTDGEAKEDSEGETSPGKGQQPENAGTSPGKGASGAKTETDGEKTGPGKSKGKGKGKAG